MGLHAIYTNGRLSSLNREALSPLLHEGEMVSFYRERRATFCIQRIDSLFVVDKVALLSLYRDTLSPILCEGEIVSLYIHTGKPPSLYNADTRSTRYRKGASSLSIERHSPPSI